MTQDKNQNDDKKQNNSSPPSSPTNALELGGWTLLRNPAAAFSKWGKIRKKAVEEKPEQKIDMRIGAMANDNASANVQTGKKNWPRRIASFVFLTAMGSSILSMNSSAIATHVVMNLDDQTLLTAMEANPALVATMLNAMDVGE